VSKIRVAIVGVGNCANSLVQGVTYYKDAAIDQEIPGLMHAVIGGYHIRDIEFVAAYDVDAKKVGLDLADAMWASENNTIKFCNVAKTGVTVERGTTLDGLGRYYKETIKESDAKPVDIVASLKEKKVDVLICYLPVGSEDATRFYAQASIDAHCAFVNALPVFIASDPTWAKKFSDAKVPIVGDDIKSQVGATITHRILAKLFQDPVYILIAPCNSTWVEIWISRICSNAIALNQRRFPRRNRSHLNLITTWVKEMYTSAPPIMSPGSMIVSGHMFALKDERSVMFPLTSNTNSRYGIRQTRQVSSSMRFAARK